MSEPWWRQAVTYQVYIRSFADGNGDGTGDVEGLRSRLDYLRGLGVDALWINPWYPSPLHDGGYDVADYRDINPRYGTLDGAQTLIDEAHARGLRVLADLVPNHTSVEHEWFQLALANGAGSPDRERYIFRPGRGPDGEEPPNNWEAVFGGSAWERCDSEWYLHLFDVSQPDLNWDHPEVKADFLDIFRFWFDRGIDGFRVDVAHALTKDPALPDVPDGTSAFAMLADGSHPYWDRDEVHEIVRTWRALADSYEGDRALVAEAWVAPNRLPMYLEADQYHQSFNFDFLSAAWNPEAQRTVIERSMQLFADTGAMPTWVLSNHDVMRHASRFGARDDAPRSVLDQQLSGDVDLGLGLRRARAAVMMMLALPGSAYLYQGEELGLPEVTDLPPEVLDDPIWERSGFTLKGRDGCRVPIPWTRAGPSFGFGAGKSWLPQPDLFGELSVEAQTGQPGATLELYRTALALRREHLATTTEFEWLDLGPNVIAFRRGALVSITNHGDEPLPMPDGEVLLTSMDEVDRAVPQDVTAWVRLG